MTDTQPPQSDPPPDSAGQDDAEELGKAARIFSGVIGIAAGVGGTFGVFISGTNSGGVPVLLVMAAFFVYLALSGQRLSRLKIGDNEAQLTRVARAAGRLLADPADKTKVEVAEDLDEISTKLPAQTRRAVEDVLAARHRAIDYEHRVQDVLLTMYPEEYVGEVVNDGERWDVLLEAGERTVAIMIKHFGQSIDSAAVARSIGYMGGIRRLSAGLLVSNQPLPEQTVKYLSTASPLLFDAVVWRGPEDNENLRPAIDRLLRA